MSELATETKFLSLIAELDDFSRKKKYPSRLNIFDAAGLDRQETKHSNFLSFLLSPHEKHGLGDTFLRRLLREVAETTQADFPISPLNVELADFGDALVRREWKGIDLLIESKNNNFVFAIENKIDASEGKDQLKKYKEQVDTEFPRYRKLLGYLTRDGDEPSHEAWVALSYSEISKSLREVLSRHGSSLSNEATIVIDHYIDLLRRFIVPDQELVDQCRQIYARHKDALDLIIRYGEVNAFDSATNSFLNAHPEISSIVIRSGRAAIFLPTAILNVVPKVDGVNWWGQSRPFLFWFNRYSNRLGLVLEIGPFASEQFRREELAARLLQYFNNKSKIAPRYTRVYSEYRKMTDEESGDSEVILATMEEFYNKVFKKDVVELTKILQKFFGT